MFDTVSSLLLFVCFILRKAENCGWWMVGNLMDGKNQNCETRLMIVLHGESKDREENEEPLPCMCQCNQEPSLELPKTLCGVVPV